jgi:hypothetical protein
MSRRTGKLVGLVGGVVVVCAVAGFYFAKSGRLTDRPQAHLLRVTYDGKEVWDDAMLVDQSQCSELLKQTTQDIRHEEDEARRKDPKDDTSFDVACVPENDPSVPAKWRAPTRTIGKWKGYDVYYYHEPEPQTLAGAFVLALPNENDISNGEPEIAMIFVDQRTCDKDVASNKDTWNSEQDYQRDAKRDPKLKATLPKMERMFKDDERAAMGACIPIANVAPLVNRFCNGLPLKLNVVGGSGIYFCDSDIVKPTGAAPQ